MKTIMAKGLLFKKYKRFKTSRFFKTTFRIFLESIAKTNKMNNCIQSLYATHSMKINDTPIF